MKTKSINDQKYFSKSESTTASPIKHKCGITNSYLRKPVGLYKWNQRIGHFDRKLRINHNFDRKMILYDEKFDDASIPPFAIYPQMIPLGDKNHFALE